LIWILWLWMTRKLLIQNGAGAQNRTVDLLITNQLLYP
jgi:hypothetical protein